MKKKGKKLVISLGLVFCMVLSILVVPKKALAAETLTTPGASKETSNTTGISCKWLLCTKGAVQMRIGIILRHHPHPHIQVCILKIRG